MANAIYPKAKQSFLGQNPSIDVDTDTIKLALVKVSGSGAVAYTSTDQYWSAINSGLVGTPQTLGGVTITNGKFTSTGATFTAVTSAGNTLAAVIYKDTGSAASSPLIAWFDTGTNVPITPNGGDITLNPDGTNGWLSL
jgi:hypothetical protein